VYNIADHKMRGTALCLLAGVAAFAAEPKKMLVFSRCEGFNHKESIAVGNAAIKAEAQKMGYAADFSLDYADLKLDNLKKYDALLLNNTTHMKTKDNPFLEPALLDYVRGGGGLVLIHAALDNFYDAPACSLMGGGRFDGHPWGARGGNWKFKVEEPDHPLNAAFKSVGASFALSDEIYQHSSPYYNRANLRVLVSLDLSDPVTAARKGQKRSDGDYAVSWLRSFGAGRVFYTSFAHDGRAWKNPMLRKHIFDGIAYCLGNLKAPDAPREIAWEKASTTERCSLLTAYANRNDGTAVAAHVEDADMDVAKAATLALGRLGCPKALALLAQLAEKPCSDACLADVRNTALGAALGRMAESGKANEAAGIAKATYGRATAPASLRAAAARVLVKADPSFFSTAIADKDKLVRQAALSAACCVPNATLAAELKKAKCPCLKVALLKKLAAKRAKETKKDVASFASDADENVAVAALEALSALGGADDISVFAAARARCGAVAAKAEEALAEMGGIGESVFELAKNDTGYLAIAAKRGETKCVVSWIPFITSADAQTRKTAWRAFGKMNNAATVDLSLAWLATVRADESDTAQNAVWYALKGLPADDRRAKLATAWKIATSTGRDAVESLLFRADGLDALCTWEKLASDPNFSKAAKKAYVSVASRLEEDASIGIKKADRAKWKATASRDEKNVKNAFDGNDKSRWTTGQNPKGVWFALDFGEKLFVDEITLDTTKSSRDTPRGCEVFASDNGMDWTGPVATCDENTVNTTTFRIGRSARHLKFVALDSRPGLHWSIHEISVKTNIDEDRRKKISATAAQYRKDLN